MKLSVRFPLRPDLTLMELEQGTNDMWWPERSLGLMPCEDADKYMKGRCIKKI